MSVPALAGLRVVDATEGIAGALRHEAARRSRRRRHEGRARGRGSVARVVGRVARRDRCTGTVRSSRSSTRARRSSRRPMRGHVADLAARRRRDRRRRLDAMARFPNVPANTRRRGDLCVRCRRPARRAARRRVHPPGVVRADVGMRHPRHPAAPDGHRARAVGHRRDGRARRARRVRTTTRAPERHRPTSRCRRSK